MKTYALSIHRTAEDVQDDIAFALVEITPEVAAYLLRYKATIQQLKTENPYVSGLTIWDYTPTWVPYEAPEEMFRYADGEEIPEGIHLVIDTEGCIALADVTNEEIPESPEVRIKYAAAHVTDTGVWWEGEEKESPYALQTFELSWADIEDVAGPVAPPAHLTCGKCGKEFPHFKPEAPLIHLNRIDPHPGGGRA